jgi:cobalt-zinc-cadmium efflux system outer membrane protein
MRSWSFAAGLALACTVTAPPALSAEPAGLVSPGLVSLSVEDVLRRAENAPEAVIARLSIREAEARRVAAGLRFPSNPRLSTEARPPFTGGSLHDIGYGATLEVPFDVGGAPPARLREADRGVDLAQAERVVARRRARTEAWAAYVRAEAARTRVAETDELVAIAERILRASKERAGSGASGDIDPSAAESEVAVLEATRESSIRQREASDAALRGALDLPAASTLQLTTPLADPPPAPDEGALVAKALSHRPELARLRARLAWYAAIDERLDKETFPRLGVYFGVDAAPVSPIFGAVGISVELPVAQRNQGPRAVIEEARVTEATRLDQQLRIVAREVGAARTAYEARRRELGVLQTRALPAAQRTLELVETGWLAGRLDIFRVTTAARDLARVRAARLDALEGAWLERVALDGAIGGALQ